MAESIIGPRFSAAIKRRQNKSLKELGRAFRATPTGTSRAAVLRAQSATSRAIRSTREAVEEISKARGISGDAAATILRQVAAGTFKEPKVRSSASAATRAGQVTRGVLVRGLMEVGSLGAPPGIPGLRSTTTSRVRRRVRGATRTAGGRAAREVKRFGVGFFGR